MEKVKILIITGLSGAGKSQAVQSLEDLGFFCIDNLPPTLIPKFIDLCFQSEGKIDRVAVVIDIRGGTFFNQVYAELDKLNKLDINYEIVFLEATDEELVKRFKETRRRHPLSPEGDIYEGIKVERELLQELRGKANIIIDTSDLKPLQLKEEIRRVWGYKDKNKSLYITVMSFGYKYGIPLDTDLLMDVRFLPNPYYLKELRPLTGKDQQVAEYVFKSEISNDFITKYYELLSFLVPHYVQEGKAHLMIAIGCTGGQHRSVAIARKLGELLQQEDYEVSVKHRDIEKRGAQSKDGYY
ncbi:UPF0042 nucleotide-binding protein [Desulfonispora thiosulfatigenes DSM 11270]|uniref:UPF0042 nucleotide-binding protein n=1 Tax=Desulfonispora thiosulfatigenes DSM 11270 TaxID=656914 RepID=A0A1W1UXK3_DESTI|nr:RNase adapter RapZ [Desulfonispora thiosulfatigenes]SMB85484.1 UPF0042 nucleotide-binding protein [Desulfonispora thiosulfatigenes DSM 11270]